MGPSGSGKSTLLAIVGALEPPTAGSVRLDGIDPFALDPAARAAFRNRRIGFVFQEYSLLPGLTALDNVVLPAVAGGAAGRDVVARAARLLDRVGLSGRSGHVRALVLAPRLVLADEPTGQLDSRNAGAVADLLVELVAEAGGMLVVVTHSEPLAARVGAVRRLVDGRLGP
jgi:predicted ABC-type transport system involved in lysophospholipase L1 biosynthesis ATPase subunit